MKHFKTLIVAAAALMAFAATASATTLTSPEGTTYTGNIAVTATNSEMDGAFVTVKCGHSEAKGSVEVHGAGKDISMTLSLLTLTGCNYHTTVKNAGGLEITSANAVISRGMEFSINTSVGTCSFSTNYTPIGSLTEGGNVSWDINSAKIPRTGGNFLCGSSYTWTGGYDFTTPNDLWVD